MCDIVVDKRLHGVLEVKDMQDGNNVDKISLAAREFLNRRMATEDWWIIHELLV